MSWGTPFGNQGHVSWGVMYRLSVCENWNLSIRGCVVQLKLVLHVIFSLLPILLQLHQVLLINLNLILNTFYGWEWGGKENSLGINGRECVLIGRTVWLRKLRVENQRCSFKSCQTTYGVNCRKIIWSRRVQ